MPKRWSIVIYDEPWCTYGIRDMRALPPGIAYLCGRASNNSTLVRLTDVPRRNFVGYVVTNADVDSTELARLLELRSAFVAYPIADDVTNEAVIANTRKIVPEAEGWLSMKS